MTVLQMSPYNRGFTLPMTPVPPGGPYLSTDTSPPVVTPPAPKRTLVPPVAPTPQPQAPQANFATVIQQMLLDARQKAGNQFTGNQAALLGGKQQISETNAKVYSQDLLNANITNEARLALLNNASSIQNPGLQSIADQQQLNQDHYRSTLDFIKNSQDAYERSLPKRSTAYTEWQDYVDSGGKLGFNEYMTMDSNRKARASSTNFQNSANIAQTTSYLASMVGADGKVSPDTWMGQRNNWQALGGSDSLFVSNFKRFLSSQYYGQVGIEKETKKAGF